MMQRSSLLLSSVCLVLMLTSCASVMDGYTMPSGYKSYGKTYKSEPGKPAPSIGYTYSAEMNHARLQELGVIAQDLAEKLDGKLSFNAEKVYLHQPESSVFYNSFDYVLREALTQRGYLLSSSPENAITVEVAAQEITEVACGDVPESMKRVSIMLALDVNKEQGIAGDYVSGLYTVPAKGFRSAGVIQAALPECAMPVQNM